MLAPLAVNVTAVLAHTVPEDCVIVIDGSAFTDIPSVVAEVQLAELTPVSVYTLLVVGVKAAVDAVIADGPPVQVYVLAPPAVKLAAVWAHTVADDGLMLSTGKVLVVIPAVAVDTQPELFVPVTVYTLDILGLKDAVCVLSVPFQVYVEAPLAVKLVVANWHAVADDGAIVMTGRLNVARPTVLDETHPDELLPLTV